MVYANDQWIQLPVRDLYDSQMMLASIQAAREMYNQAREDMKDFNKEYSNFMTPFAKDMQRYQDMIGNMQNVINDAYNRGIDPLRSQEGRFLIRQAMNSINPAEYSAMKANAKIGYAYLDAMQKLRQAGRFSKAQEDFDIMQSGETPFDDFATLGPGGTFNTWGRVSPIEATTLRDLAHKSYEGRTARTLTKEDFQNDPRLKNYAWDPRYEWTGYLDSDLMKVAPGASASLSADPRAAYFRDLSRQKVIASGKKPTEENIEAQWQRDIADASSWALIDPTRKADDFAKMDQQYRYNAALKNQEHINNMEEIREAGKYRNSGKKGEGDDISGGYQQVVSDRSAAQLNGFKSQAMLDYISKNANRLNEYKTIVDIQQRAASGNPITDKERAKVRAFEGKVMANFMLSKTSSGDKVVNKILSLEGGEGVGELNSILSPRTVYSHWKDDHDHVMEYMGYELEKDGWYKNRGNGGKIVTPHQIMQNILKYESGSGFRLRRSDGTAVTQNDIIKHLNAVQNEDYYWTNATPKERADRTDRIKSLGKYMVAPDENGVNRVYMQVRLGKQSGWHLWQGEHDGYWMETNLTQLPSGELSNETAPITYSSESNERKAKTNAAVSQAYSDN